MSDNTAIRDSFEDRAHSGYVSYGISMTDGYYAPEPRTVTVHELRRSVPLTPEFFRYNTEFRPTQEEINEYNETFHVGTDYRPDHLEIAVRWSNGWKTYTVTGTRHAYYFLRKLAGRRGFERARLNDPLVTRDGYLRPNVISFDESDITGSDRHGKFRALLDRNNSHYDLRPDNLPMGARPGQSMTQYGG